MIVYIQCIYICSYNNQWMVVDYNKFKRGQTELQDGLLYVLEQLPWVIVTVTWRDTELDWMDNIMRTCVHVYNNLLNPYMYMCTYNVLHVCVTVTSGTEVKSTRRTWPMYWERNLTGQASTFREHSNIYSGMNNGGIPFHSIARNTLLPTYRVFFLNVLQVFSWHL